METYVERNSEGKKGLNKKGCKPSSMTEAAYKGFNVSPFVPFTKEDYYVYAGAKPIGVDEPLIFRGDDMDIVISGTENLNEIDIQVFIGEDIAYGTIGEYMTFFRALKLGKKIASLDGNGPFGIANWIEENTDLISLM